MGLRAWWRRVMGGVAEVASEPSLPPLQPVAKPRRRQPAWTYPRVACERCGHMVAITKRSGAIAWHHCKAAPTAPPADVPIVSIDIDAAVRAADSFHEF